MTTASSSGSRIVRILVVDDHVFFREGLAAWLNRQAGFTCCGFADTVASARTAIASQRPDLVLLDLQIGDEDGMDLLTDNDRPSGLPRVIVLSQRDESFYAERMLRAGARGYVMKAEAADTVLDAMHTVMQGGIHVSPALSRHLLSRLSRDGRGTRGFSALADRELQVFNLLGRGMTTKAIAAQLEIGVKTVDSYRESMKLKLGLPDSVALIQQATLWAQTGQAPPGAGA